MSKIEVDAIDKQSGSTLTLGGSGTAVTLACGATQTGFGRTGTVDWQTGSIKTATFTAANGEGYFCNTSGGAFTVNLPAGSAGAIVSVQDYNNTFDTNALTVDPNGSEKINGGAGGEIVTLDTEGRGVTFVYIDSTVGWRSVQDNDFAAAGLTPSYVAATGGNSTATAPCGNYKIHTFTGPGTFCVSNAGNSAGNNQLEYIIVAGAGAGGGRYLAGGGGAGGFRFAAPSLAPLTYPAKPLAAPAGITATVQGYPIVIGAGGTGNSCGGGTDSTPGSVSSGLGLTSAGGGAGHQDQPGALPDGRGGSGGSGGGGSVGNPGGVLVYKAGSGNTPPVSPSQGNDGGSGNQTSAPGSSNICGANFSPGNPYVAGGGGGATARGGCGVRNPPSPTGGTVGAGGAGAGVPALFGTSGQNCGSNYYFAGGGGGAGTKCGVPSPTPPGTGGLGGGQAGNRCASAADGTANTGGGGGGTDGRCSPGSGGGGGSGIVIIRYKFQ
jgi:hypothetical protein